MNKNDTNFRRQSSYYHFQNEEAKEEKKSSLIACLFVVTLFQIPHYEHLQVLICNGNSLTTLAGVEHIKHLWKLDVRNNQVWFNDF